MPGDRFTTSRAGGGIDEISRALNGCADPCFRPRGERAISRGGGRLVGIMSKLFDHALRETRAPRLKGTLSKTDFLFRRAAEGVRDRLDDVIRAFPSAAIVGPQGGVFADSLKGRAGEERLIQIETSPAMAASCAARSSEMIIADEDVLNLPGDLDLIVGGMTLHRENDPVGILTQMRLALKPDGLALVAMFGGRTLNELRASFAEAEIEVEGGVSPRVAPMGEIRDLGGLLQRAGFALPVADVDRFDIHYESAFHLMRDLRDMGEANALAARRRTFTRRKTMMRMAEIYASAFPAPNHRIAATFEIVFLTGWAPDASQQKPLAPGSAKTSLASALGGNEISLGERPGPFDPKSGRTK